jgi:membrane-associated phospholipid phosphatase
MNFKQKIKEIISNPQEVSYIFLGIYFLIIAFFIFKRGLNLKLDMIFFTFFLGTLLLGKTKNFLKDWLPFILVFFGYEAMRGIADDLNANVHVWEMIKADTFLFGQIPSAFLQSKLWHPEYLSWYDFAGFFIYLSHFWYSFIVGFIIWIKKREYFRTFSWGFMILCALGFLTYVLFPAMAPWDAANHNYITGVEKIFIPMVEKINLEKTVTIAYLWIGPNQVAAMPSMHSAWAWFSSLFLVYFFGRRFWPIFLYPLVLFFALVYMGEHYVVDVIAGVIYASFSFWFAKRFLNKEKRPAS